MMFTNTPNPQLYRLAELRRREDRIIASQRRRHRLLAAQAGPLEGLRNRLGVILVAAGSRMMTPACRAPKVREQAAV
ncbi:hypothetical protein BH23CHL2_BH23CHL2_24430 [soil metagenome]